MGGWTVIRNGDGDWRLVGGGFRWAALLVPALWLLWRGLWRTLVLYLALAAFLTLLGQALGQPAAALVMLAYALWFALEAPDLELQELEKKGWRIVGQLRARDHDSAEAAWLAAEMAAGRTP